MKRSVERLLTHWQVCIITDLFVVLSRDPFHIHNREFLTADPFCIGNLILQYHCIDLCTHTKITGYIGENPVMHIIPFCIPTHNRSRCRTFQCGCYFCNRSLQYMRQCINQPVTVSVACSIHNRLFTFIKTMNQKADSSLSGCQQAGWFYNKYKSDTA